MPTKKQDELFVEISVNDDASDQVKQENPTRTIKMTGHTATAYRELDTAGTFGVHKSRIDLDALARFEQLGIPFRRFFNPRDSSDWSKQNWFRLAFPRHVEARIVAEVAA